MFEESASEISSSIWESINSWFTPTVLFILLNLMIATIAFTSALANQKRQHNTHKTQPNQQGDGATKLSVLQRIKSINFLSQYRSQQQQNLTLRLKTNPDSDNTFDMETHSNYIFQDMTQEHLQTHTQIQNHYHFEDNQVLEEDTDSDGIRGPTEENAAEQNEHDVTEVYSQSTEAGHLSRSRSETVPDSGDIHTKLTAKLRKWSSMKSDVGHSEDVYAVEARRPATMREKRNAGANDSDEEVDAKADDFINKFKQQLKLQRMDSIIRYNEDGI